MLNNICAKKKICLTIKTVEYKLMALVTKRWIMLPIQEKQKLEQKKARQKSLKDCFLNRKLKIKGYE